MTVRADEASDLDVLVQAIHATRQFVDARPTPDLTGPVLRRITGREGPPAASARWQNIWRSLWSPRAVTFRLRPVYGIVTTVLLVGFVAIEGHKSVTPTREAHNPVTFVQFQLHAPDAEGVRLAGTFTDWQPVHELHQVFPGVWTVILPLSPGVHDYAFLVNGGDWVADPYAPVVQDGFGGQANRMALLPPQGESPL